MDRIENVETAIAEAEGRLTAEFPHGKTIVEDVFYCMRETIMDNVIALKVDTIKLPIEALEDDEEREDGDYV
jgi:hypothetical protein